MTADETGRAGEALAARFLESQGWRVRARRYRVRGGELDLVAERQALIIFVEVKARAFGALDDGRGAVTAAKRRRIVKAARSYLARYRLSQRACRFDVITVTHGSGAPRVVHIEAAFDTG